jgi:F-box protein 18 (helicase)
MAILPPPPGSAKPAAPARPQPAEQPGGGGTAALIERARTLRFQFDQKARAQSVVAQAARAAADAAAVRTPGAATRTVKYDENQQQLIDAKDHIVIGEAVAGSGKTTTAVGYAAARPGEKLVYLCFGKANADEARQRFPSSNVDVFNIHGLAYRAIGHKYDARLLKQGSWRPRDIAEQLGVENRIAGCIGKTLASFYSSVDSDINESHLKAVADWGLTPLEQGAVLEHTRAAWRKIIAPGSKLPVTHDTYLKLWTMSEPRLNYDCMILDEAQDTNPITEQLVLGQLDHCRLLAIGDRHQSIFGFRGATNAMQNLRAIEGHRVVTMPRTWRFGPRTADVANKILQNLKGESVEIQGMGKDTGWGRQSTLLTRTNSGLFEEAASRQGRGVHWLGGVENYNLDVIVDAYNIWARSLHAVRAPFMKRFRSWNEFVDYSESSRDAETRMLIKVVERHEHKTPQLVAQVKKHEVKDPAAAELTLTTLHKSKGMEWDCVRIGNDFEFLFEAEKEICETGELSKATEQEVNLLYVGITRARGVCKLNDETEQWLKELPQLQAERMRALELMNSAGPARPGQ